MIWWFSRLSKTVVENYHLDAFCALFVLNLDLFILAWFLGGGVYGTSILCHRVWYPGSNTQESILGNYYQEPIPINPWIHELINPSTHQPINPSTLAFCITVYSTREPISGNQYSGTTTRNPSFNPWIHELINPSIHQPINPSTLYGIMNLILGLSQSEVV